MLKTFTMAVSCLFACSFLSPALHAAEPVRDWTMLVFINGNNNLDTYGAFNINQMETVGSTDKVNVVVQWASMAAPSVKRLFIKKDNDINTVTSPVVQDMGAVDMGDYKSLVDFIRWGAANYPARHYFVDVWDHGGGWHLTAQAKSSGVHIKDISWDDKSNHFMKTEELAEAMQEAAQIIGHPVDVYGSDACLMGMAEIADQMGDAVGTYIGSEETEPLKGWPYDILLTKWNALDSATGNDIAKILVPEYVNAYSGGEFGTENATLSAFDMTKRGEFNAAVKTFATAVRKLEKPARDKLLAASQTAQRYTDSDYADLLDVLANISAAGVDGLGRDETNQLQAATKGFVIASAATASLAKSQGLAIWLPTDNYTYSSYSARYNAMHFQADTGWGDTLALLNPTQRKK